MSSPIDARRRRISWARRAIARAVLALAVGAAGATVPLAAQDIEPGVADFWAAGSPEEIDGAVERILALDPGIESLWPLMRAGGAYDADVPRGRQVLARRNPEGVEYRTIAWIPPGYDPALRYPVRVYLHGGVSRPRRDEAAWWRNQERYGRDDAIVLFPESWNETMWWQASQIENLAGVINDLKRTYNVDENQVHLLGVSDGGTGAFYHAFKAPTPWAGFVSFNGHPAVLASPSTAADGQMHVTNLRNKPFFVVNGGQDRLYPISSVVPFLQLFVNAGVYVDFRPRPEAGHNMQWWDEESPRVDAFIVAQTRRPLPDRLVWETESADRFNRAHWVVITELGSVEGESGFDDFNEIASSPPSVPIGFNQLGLLEGGGIVLIDVLSGSIAEMAGVRAGDVLVGVNGRAVATVDDLREAVQAPRDGPGLDVEVEREGERLAFVLTPPDDVPAGPARTAFPRPDPAGRVQLARNGNEILVATRGVRRYTLLLSPEQFDFLQPIRVTTNDVLSFEGVVEPDPAVLLRWAARDRDRTMLFGAELDVAVRAP